MESNAGESDNVEEGVSAEVYRGMSPLSGRSRIDELETERASQKECPE